MISAALGYLNIGFSVIPIGKNKKPMVETWKEYQARRATKEEVAAWFGRFPDANIAVVTGVISGIVAVDVEAGGSTNNLPPTVISKTGGGGFHFLYRHPGILVKNAVRIRDRMDIRGDGGYIVLPPSIHASGKPYEWAVSIEDAEFAEFPVWILEKTCNQDEQLTDWQSLLSAEIYEGSRNDTAAQVAGKVLHHLPLEFWDLAGWAFLKEWNQGRNKPPLDESELKNVWCSIKRAELEKRKDGETKEKNRKGRRSIADQLIEIVNNDSTITLFHDQYNDPFVAVEVKSHREVWPTRSKQFRRWLSVRYWEQKQQSASPDSITTALNFVEGRACFDGEQHSLNNRIAVHEDGIFYDLAGIDWRAINITKNGWEIVLRPPILFRRYSHQSFQVEPVRGGNIRKLLDFVNISDESQKLLFLVYVVSCFIPEFPHPVIILHGGQGSAKSTQMKILRKIIDPSVTEDVDCPRDPAELAQVLSHHWCVYFDNLSGLPDWLSDKLCKAVTGSAFAKRELYSDDDDVIRVFRRCIGINGINQVVTKPDLLERAILFELEKIADGERKPERQIMEQLARERPTIIGGIFDILSKAMTIHPTIKLATLPRMADFTLWGCAIAEALGQTKEEFLSAYYRNINNQNEALLADNLVATVLCGFMESKSEWDGTPSNLLAGLTSLAKEQGVNVEKEKGWPKAANTLSKRLNELKTNLAAEGIKVMHSMEHKKRMIRLQKIVRNTVAIVASSPGGQLVGDGSATICNDSPKGVSESFPEANYENAGGNDGNDGDDTFEEWVEKEMDRPPIT